MLQAHLDHLGVRVRHIEFLHVQVGATQRLDELLQVDLAIAQLAFQRTELRPHHIGIEIPLKDLAIGGADHRLQSRLVRGRRQLELLRLHPQRTHPLGHPVLHFDRGRQH